MRRRFTLSLAGMVLVMMLPMASATATPPTDVTFDFEFIFAASDSTFVATGSAVDDGKMCPSGTLAGVGFRQSHFQKNVTPIDKFICDEEGDFGPGDTFIMKVQVHVVDFPDIRGNWVIMRGTGAFEDIHGTGSTAGHFILDADWNVVSVAETRSGTMHLD